MGHLLRSLAVVAVLVAGAPPLAAFEGPRSQARLQDGARQRRRTPERGCQPVPRRTTRPPPRRSACWTPASRPTRRARPTRPSAPSTAAISGGGLASQQMAQALYYRGLAYRKKGKPGLAIPDLTSAVWLKDGLVRGREAGGHCATRRRLSARPASATCRRWRSRRAPPRAPSAPRHGRQGRAALGAGRAVLPRPLLHRPCLRAADGRVRAAGRRHPPRSELELQRRHRRVLQQHPLFGGGSSESSSGPPPR